MKTFRILLDMDEVLSDFVGGACNTWGVSKGWMQQQRLEAAEWSMAQVLNISMDEFWAEIDEGGFDFWNNLEPLPWMTELVDFVQSITDDWHIVSAPSRSEYCYSGKVAWLKRYFGRRFDQFALTPHKHIFANSNTILIDDRASNIEKFISYGGRGQLFPAVGNDLFQYAEHPVNYLKSRLGDLVSLEAIATAKQFPLE